MNINIDFGHALLVLVVLATMVLAGLTVLRVLRVEGPREWLVALAAPVMLAVWADVVALSVALRMPLKLVAVPMLLLTAVAAAAALMRRRLSVGHGPQSRRRAIWLLSVATTSAFVAILPYCVLGFEAYPGSRLPDGWAYVAYGQYLWSYSHGTTQALEPLYTYSLTLLNSRHVASGVLGVLSAVVSPGDTQLAIPYLQGLGIFSYACACGAVAAARQWGSRQCLLFMVLASVNGWVSNVIWANNHDNLLALALFPALASVAARQTPLSARDGILAAILTGALIHAYPELAGLAVLCCGGLYLHSVLQRGGLRAEWRGIAWAVAGALVIVSPVIAPITRFFLHQASVGLAAGPKPGTGMFPGLLGFATLPSAVWALGTEHMVTIWPPTQTLLAGALLLLLVIGLVHQMRRREWGWLGCLVVLMVLTVAMIVVQRYDYGAYKILLVGWWIVAMFLTTAVTWLMALSSRWRVAGVLVLLVAAVPPAAGVARSLATVIRLPPHSMNSYRQLADVPALVGTDPIALLVEDREGIEWALYYLRNARSRVGDFTGYIASEGARPLLENDARYPWETIRYVLTDGKDPGPVKEQQDWKLVWRSPVFALWDTRDSGWAAVTDVQLLSAHDVSTLDVRLVAGSDGCAEFSEGGAAERSADSAWLLTSPFETGASASPPGSASSFRVPAGVSRLTVKAPPGANVLERLTRTILTFAAPRLVERRLVNPNGLDLVAGERFIWLGGGATEVHVHATNAGTARVRAEAQPGPSVAPGLASRRLRVGLLGTDARHDVDVSPGPWALDVDVPQGDSVIVLEPLDQVTVPRQPNGDSRPLMIGLSKFRVELGHRDGTCR